MQQVRPAGRSGAEPRRSRERLTPERDRGREPCRIGVDVHARQVQPVRVPAGADGRLAGDETVGVELDRLAEQVEPGRLERERAIHSELPSPGRRTLPVTWVDVLVDAARVVQETEEEDELLIDGAQALREDEPGGRDTAPVLLAVERGVAARGPGENGLDEREVRHRAPVCADALHAATIAGRARAGVPCSGRRPLGSGGGMSFGSPYLLVTLLAVPAALGCVLLARRRATRFAVRFPNLEVLTRVVSGGRSWRRTLPLVALMVALAALGVALARPHVTLRVPTERATVVLVLDTSRSMLSDDVKPSRLEAAKSAAQLFLDRVPARLRVGLVTFSGDVAVAAVPTREHERVQESVAAIDPYMGVGGGTAIGDAIARAVEVGTDAVARDDGGAIVPGEVGRLVSILFLSDGRQNRGILPPLEGAARARAAGIPVFAVALGTRDGPAQSGPGAGGANFFGGGPRRAPDPETLRAIAEATGGEFTWARTSEELDDAYRDLGSRLGRDPQRTEVTAAFVAVAAVALLAGALSGAWWSPRLP